MSTGKRTARREDAAFASISDLTITEENVFPFMQGAHARWKIENKALKTLKNKGYHLDHNLWSDRKLLINPTRQLRCPLVSGCLSEMIQDQEIIQEKVYRKFQKFSIGNMENLYYSMLVYKPFSL